MTGDVCCGHRGETWEHNEVLSASPGVQAPTPYTCPASAPAPCASLLVLRFNCCSFPPTPCELCSCLQYLFSLSFLEVHPF